MIKSVAESIKKAELFKCIINSKVTMEKEALFAFGADSPALSKQDFTDTNYEILVLNINAGHFAENINVVILHELDLAIVSETVMDKLGSNLVYFQHLLDLNVNQFCEILENGNFYKVVMDKINNVNNEERLAN